MLEHKLLSGVIRYAFHHGQVEEKLSQLASIVESSDDAIIGGALDGTILSWNKGAQRIYGYAPEEIIGRSFSVLHPPHLPDEIQKLRERLMRGEAIDHYETERIRKDGTRITVSLTISPIRDAAGKIVGTSAIGRDITERKQAEEALRKRTEQILRYQTALVELAKAGNPNLESVIKKITEVDAGMLEVERVSIWFFSEDRSEIVCKDLYELSKGSHQKGMRLLARQYPRYFQSLEESRTVAANDARADSRTNEFTEGYLIPFGVTSMMDVPIRLHGKVVGIVCHEHTGPRREWTVEEQDFAASISDRVSLALASLERDRAEKAVRDSEARKSAILEAASDAIITIDHEGKVIEWNPAAERTFGTPRAEAIGREMAELIIPPSLRESHRRGLAHYLKTGESTVLRRRVEFSALRADGTEFPVELYITSIPGEGSPMFTGYARDITERKALEKMKDDLFRDAAHELRTPYAMVKMGLDMLGRGFQADDRREVESGRKIIASNVARMEHDVEDILDAFRIESELKRTEEGKERVSLKGFLKEAADSYSPQIQAKGLGFQLDIEEGLPPAAIAKTDLLRVLRNVLDNAVKFTHSGHVGVAVKKKDKFVLILVEDTGRGMRKEDLKRVFEKFFKVSPATPGVGLGLSIAKLLVERAGGRIAVTSPGPDRGTTVEIQIPAADLADSSSKGGS